MKTREVRATLKLKNREPIGLGIDAELWGEIEPFLAKIKKLVWAENIDTNTDVNTTNSFIVNGKKVIILSDKKIDDADALKKIKEDIEHTKGFIKSIESKLNNEKFSANAPEKVLEMERKKLSDGQEKLKQLEK